MESGLQVFTTLRNIVQRILAYRSADMAVEAGCSTWSSREEEDGEAKEDEDNANRNTTTSSDLTPSPCTAPHDEAHPQPERLTFHSQEAPRPRGLLGSWTSAFWARYFSSKPASFWHLTPDTVMVKILAYLDDVDRCRVSSVCSNWRRNFRTPCLWRRHTFVFKDCEARKHLKPYCKFLRQLGSHLHHVRIKLAIRDRRTKGTLCSTFEKFLRQLDKCHGVHRISVNIVGFRCRWHYWAKHRREIVRALCRRLKKQSHLRIVVLKDCMKSRRRGKNALRARSYGTRRHPKLYLTHLDLRDYSFRKAEVLRPFAPVALSSLRLNLERTNETILQTLTHMTATSLSRMILDFYPLTYLEKLAIGSNCWRNVALTCRALAVEVRIHGLCSLEKCTTVLDKNIPLDELHLEVENLSNEASLQDVENLLTHLANTYNQTLSRLCVEVEPNTALSAADLKMPTVINLIRRCHKLTDVSIDFGIQAADCLQLLETIYLCRATSNIGAKSPRLSLNVRGMTPDFNQAFKKLESVAMSNINGKMVFALPN